MINNTEILHYCSLYLQSLSCYQYRFLLDKYSVHIQIEIYSAGGFLVVILGFCQGVNEVCTLLGCYAVLIGS
jgi:hypothetical protein